MAWNRQVKAFTRAAILWSLATVALAQQNWCVPGEIVLLSGSVGQVKGDLFAAKGVLSLCASPKDKPYKYLAYRYGNSSPELVYEAPEDGQFMLDHQQILPKAGIDILYFRIGDYTYAITDCQGMLCGIRTVRLMVFKDKKRILQLDADPQQFVRNIDFLDDLADLPFVRKQRIGVSVDEK